MSAPALDRPRVLVAAGPERTEALYAQFALEPLSGWEMHAAGSFAQAHYRLQHVSFDLLMVGHDLMRCEGPQGLAWLTSQRAAPVVFLGDEDALSYAQALELGVQTCLPWTLATDHPPLLHRIMQQALEAWTARIEHQRTREQLAESRRHVDRLVQMIWRLTPRHDDHWYSQRHMLERLQEELARCQRHQVPLSIAVGELQPSEPESGPRLPGWAAEAIVRGKRRSDIVGQYGPNGFLLLMVHTPKPGGVTCCRRLQDHLEHPAEQLDAPHRPLRSFFGIASTHEEQNTPQALLRMAEQNLEIARNRTAACVVAD